MDATQCLRQEEAVTRYRRWRVQRDLDERATVWDGMVNNGYVLRPRVCAKRDCHALGVWRDR